MHYYRIEGGHALRGTVTISGSKNACLPLMCAALLTDQPTILENVPDLRDIRAMMDLLEHLNARVILKNGRMMIDPRSFDTDWVPYDMMSRMRASMYAFGPMIARRRKAAVSKPGGCKIGDRPIDLHLKGFRALGVTMTERQRYVHARHAGLRGAEIDLVGSNGPSVGATCNVLMAAVMAQGTTKIYHAAREPEVQQLCNFLNSMGAEIEGIGGDTLTITGVPKLRGTRWRVVPDRIEAATFAVAAVITNGDVVLDSAAPQDMEATLETLREWGALVEPIGEGGLRVRRDPNRSPRALGLDTGPFPGLATDVQPLFVALLATTPGISRVRETIYVDRFKHAGELNRMGADITRENETAMIKGVEGLRGTTLASPDLRAGAALVLAAMSAKGTSTLAGVEHIERGYERFEQKLGALGARIRRLEAEAPLSPNDTPDWELIAPRQAAADADTVN